MADQKQSYRATTSLSEATSASRGIKSWTPISQVLRLWHPHRRGAPHHAMVDQASSATQPQLATDGDAWPPKPLTYIPQFILLQLHFRPRLKQQTKAHNPGSTLHGRDKSNKQRTGVGLLNPAGPNHKTSLHLITKVAPAFPPATTPAGSLTRLTRDGAIAEGSESKQQRQTSAQRAPTRPAETEPPRTKARINEITVHFKNGTPVTTATCEEPAEARIDQIYVERTSKVSIQKR